MNGAVGSAELNQANSWANLIISSMVNVFVGPLPSPGVATAALLNVFMGPPPSAGLATAALTPGFVFFSASDRLRWLTPVWLQLWMQVPAIISSVPCFVTVAALQSRL